jgi:nucleoside-diphosphate-sugar epimerase
MILLNNWRKAKGECYNISGEEEVNLVDLAWMIKEEAKSNSRIVYKKPEIAQPQQVRVDISRMKALGYKPKVNIKEGVKRLVRFYENE